VEPNRRTIAVIVLVGVAILLVAGASAVATDTASEERVKFVDVSNETTMWPYTSKARSFEGRTLAINVVIRGDPAAVERHFRERARGNWTETDENESDVDLVERPLNGTATAWAGAGGARRYVYMRTGDQLEGVWLTESYQLHDGDYLGTRNHIRAYESPADEDWVALQAHHEHWDWFRLRHTVDGVQSTQTAIEREFMDRPFVEELSRVFMGNDAGPDMEGWVTVIRFREAASASLAAILAVPVVRRMRRTAVKHVDVRTRRMIALSGGLAGLYLAVRFGAIGAERLLPSANPLALAGAFYPLLFLGLPTWAFFAARPLDQQDAAVAATVGFTAGVLLDYTYLQIHVLPLDTIVHRLSLVAALGLVAVGGARVGQEEPVLGWQLRAGVLLWLATIGLPLLRIL